MPGAFCGYARAAAHIRESAPKQRVNTVDISVDSSHDAYMPPQDAATTRLSRELIVDAYLRLAEAEESDRISLRRLGRELGVDPTAVYRHFRDKDEILAAAADRLLAQVTEGLDPSGGWRDQLRDVLLALRRVYLLHPRALLALQLAPPRLENGFGNVERCIALLRAAGLPEDEVPVAYEALETYTIGATVFDARATDESLASWRHIYRTLPADRFPNLTATASSLYLDIEKAFRYGLELMLDSIEMRVRRLAPLVGSRRSPPLNGEAIPEEGAMKRRGKANKAAAVAAAGILALLAAACGRSVSSSQGTTGDISPTKGLVATTPAGTKHVASVVWSVYRDVNSLDPIFAFDYPENTADSLMCESLLRQAPSGALQPGLATVASPSPTKMVFTIRAGAKFWDGNPVTPADVVYSLDRNTNPQLGGFYSASFSRVSSIASTGADQVTITLKQPDYWLEGELASMPGIIIEKSFAQQQGKNYGTPAGKIMCTGAYMFKSWTPGVGVVAVASPHYWDSSVKPLIGQITIKGAPDVSAFTAAMETGGIQGSYAFALPTLDQLKGSSAVKVYQGPGWSTDALIVATFKGVLGDVRVRQALSMALDRQGIIDSVYKGAALMPRWLSNPGTFGYGSSVFTAAYDSAPLLSQNLAAARKLVSEAGAAGKTLTIGTSSQLANIAAVTGAYEAAGQAIGLKVALRSVSAQNFINFFIDPKARAGVDAFPTVNYGDYADPAAMLATAVLPDGSQNYSGFNDPKITADMEQARSTADPGKRAALVAAAEKLAVQQLPWIPNVQPTALLLLNKSLTGAVSSFAYMFAPWANQLGGTG